MVFDKFKFNKKQLVYIFLLTLLIFVIAIRSSIYKTINERFIDNAFTVDIVKKQSSQSNSLPSSTKEPELSDEEKARRARMNKWKDCNIFNCKNPDSEADYEAWLKAQKDKLNKYLDDDNNKIKPIEKQKKCPPRISMSEWNEDILTDDEKEVEARLEDLQDKEDELNQKIKELQERLAEQEREFAMNAATQQQAMNDLENAQRSMKDMKFYENAIDMHVKPWQEAIKKVDKKVTSYEKPIKSIKDLLKKIDELKKKVESIQSVGAAPPKKKKKKGLLGKIKGAFK